MDSDSPACRSKRIKDRTSCIVTCTCIGMVIALLVDNLSLGFAVGVALSLVSELLSRRGINPSSLFRTLKENHQNTA